MNMKCAKLALKSIFKDVTKVITAVALGYIIFITGSVMAVRVFGATDANLAGGICVISAMLFAFRFAMKYEEYRLECEE